MINDTEVWVGHESWVIEQRRVLVDDDERSEYLCCFFVGEGLLCHKEHWLIDEPRSCLAVTADETCKGKGNSLLVLHF